MGASELAARLDSCTSPWHLPAGVELRALLTHRDQRGAVAEIYRQHWDASVAPIQWTVIWSSAGTLRGMHVHVRHDDYLIAVDGVFTVGLRDLRAGSPTDGISVVFQMTAAEPQALTIPHGVAHGFYFHAPSTFVLGTSHYWDAADELGCLWNDPDLRIEWPSTPAIISERDRTLPPLRDLVPQIPPFGT